MCNVTGKLGDTLPCTWTAAPTIFIQVLLNNLLTKCNKPLIPFFLPPQD